MDVRAMTSRCSCWFGVVRCNVRAPWDVLHDIFYGVSSCLYKSTCLCAILSAFWFGLYLGVLSFLHIWIVRPLQAMLRMQATMLRMFMQAFVGETIASVMYVLREVFSTRRVDIETLNTDLNGVFLRKQHWPAGVFHHYILFLFISDCRRWWRFKTGKSQVKMRRCLPSSSPLGTALDKTHSDWTESKAGKYKYKHIYKLKY